MDYFYPFAINGLLKTKVRKSSTLNPWWSNALNLSSFTTGPTALITTTLLLGWVSY